MPILKQTITQLPEIEQVHAWNTGARIAKERLKELGELNNMLVHINFQNLK